LWFILLLDYRELSKGHKLRLFFVSPTGPLLKILTLICLYPQRFYTLFTKVEKNEYIQAFIFLLSLY